MDVAHEHGIQKRPLIEQNVRQARYLAARVEGSRVELVAPVPLNIVASATTLGSWTAHGWNA
jgi:glutamate/tyrosine decarboxylase-like PLP-dependent enzyme